MNVAPRQAGPMSGWRWLPVVLLACACSPRSPDHEVIGHVFPEGRSGIATGVFEQPAVNYPPIRVADRFEHVLTFQTTPMMPPLRRGAVTHGPLVLFSDDFETIVFSPMDHFFSSVVWFEDGAIGSGIAGEIDEIPAGFRHRFLQVRGRGIAATIERWGKLLLCDRGRERLGRYADRGLSYLGYWTDNGAAYYYATAEGMNEEETLLAVRDDAVARGIPYGYFQLDSWWYFKEESGGIGPPGGLIRWEPQEAMFPDGLAAFQQRLGLPLVAHNRWFARDNAYRDQYAFVEDERMALPLERGVFERFMQDAKDWGVFTYEQDWLMNQYWGVGYLRRAPGRAEAWMQHITSAAAEQELTVQLCMAGAAHLMDSVDRPAVTTIRTSIDYAAGLAKECFWPQFHQVNMLAWALGVWPFKDNFHAVEDHGFEEALIATLSGGMVGAGDAIGRADPSLLLHTCRADGLLLKPDRPALPLDAMFLPHDRPYLVATFSRRAGLGRWTYLAAFHLASGHPERTAEDELFASFAYDGRPIGDTFVWPARVRDWHLDPEEDLGIHGPVVVYDWRAGTAFLAERAFEIPKAKHLYQGAYLVLAPVFSNGMALIGETGKFVTVADRRLLSIQPGPEAIDVVLEGAFGERVCLRAFDVANRTLLEPVCVTIGPQGQAEARLGRR